MANPKLVGLTCLTAKGEGEKGEKRRERKEKRRGKRGKRRVESGSLVLRGSHTST